DAGLRLEIGDGVRGDVVGPVVDVEDRLLLSEGGAGGQEGTERKGDGLVHLVRTLLRDGWWIGGAPGHRKTAGGWAARTLRRCVSWADPLQADGGAWNTRNMGACGRWRTGLKLAGRTTRIDPRHRRGQ